MADAVIVDVVRSALGRRIGRLSGWHPAELAAEMLVALTARNTLDPVLIEDVILGCVMQIGAQSMNLARSAVLAAGWPDAVPATTIDRQCGSSQQAVHFAAQGVIAGAYDVVIAGGVEVMSLVPMGVSVSDGAAGTPFGPAVIARYEGTGGLIPLGQSGERLAAHANLSRHELDAYALHSIDNARHAAATGRFANEIVPLHQRTMNATPRHQRLMPAPELVLQDEGPGPVTAESLERLRPTFDVDGVITAGNSAPIADGASAALIMSAGRAAELGLTPRARFHAGSVVGCDPVLALTAPERATQRVLDNARLTCDDIDLFEVHEAFAAVVLAWQRSTHADPARVNVNGGAIALGHAVGNSGTRQLATLVNELERTGGRWGLQTMASAGGLAPAMIIERLG